MLNIACELKLKNDSSLCHISCGYPLALRNAATRLAWCYDFKIFGLFVLIQFIDIVVIFNIIEIVSADSVEYQKNYFRA